MISLASLSGVTKTIKLGAGVVIIPLRDPVILAKQSATLDQFSNGRLLLGLGLGGSRRSSSRSGHGAAAPIEETCSTRSWTLWNCY